MLDTSSVDTIDPFTRAGLTQNSSATSSRQQRKPRKTTPTTESGADTVSKAFHALNGPLVVDEYLNKLHALDASDLQRARAHETVALDAELRKRKPVALCGNQKLRRFAEYRFPTPATLLKYDMPVVLDRPGGRYRRK